MFCQNHLRERVAFDVQEADRRSRRNAQQNYLR
jgi:hypothetical protein